MIDRTYGHLAQDAEDQDRSLLDAYDTAARNGSGHAGARNLRETTRREAKVAVVQRWAVAGSNRRPPACKAGALTS